MLPLKYIISEAMSSEKLKGGIKVKVNREQKRLKAIKLKYFFFGRECASCGEKFKREKMWRVYRYGINQTCHPWYYCQNCMHSAEEVLYEIGVSIDIQTQNFTNREKDDIILCKCKRSVQNMKTYTEEFKKTIVELYEKGNKTKTELAREYGTSECNIRTWIKKYWKNKNING